MSENVNENARPQDLVDLEKALNEINNYKNTVAKCVFGGNQAKEVVSLTNFLTETFNQLLSKYQSHPYIVEVNAKAAQEIADANMKAEQEGIAAELGDSNAQQA